MSPPGKDGTMCVGDAQAKRKSDKGNSAPRLPDARNMFQSQPTKLTFTFSFKPLSSPPFIYSISCNEGINFVAGLNQSGPSFAQVLESNIRKSVEEYEFQSFHGEIQFLETKQKNLVELSEMAMPMTLKEHKTFPHSSKDDVIDNHDHLSPDASGIPLMQICGSGFQKKGTSLSSCKSSVQAMDTENVAGTSFTEVNSNQFNIRTSAKEMCGFVNDQIALTEMENCSDKACKGKKQVKEYLKRCKRIDHGIQKNKKLHLKGSTSKKVHDPKDKAVKMLENNRDL